MRLELFPGRAIAFELLVPDEASPRLEPHSLVLLLRCQVAPSLRDRQFFFLVGWSGGEPCLARYVDQHLVPRPSLELQALLPNQVVPVPVLILELLPFSLLAGCLLLHLMLEPLALVLTRPLCQWHEYGRTLH